MNSGVGQHATIRLGPSQSRKLMNKMATDPKFAGQLRELFSTKNEQKIAAYLRKNGFRTK